MPMTFAFETLESMHTEFDSILLFTALIALETLYLLPHINRAEIPNPLRPVATPAWISPITPGLSIQNNVPGTQVYLEDCSG